MSDDPYSPHDKPLVAADYVANSALEAAKEAAGEVHREIEHLYVLVRLTEIEHGTPDATTAAWGEDPPSARGFVADILTHARAIAANNGIPLDIAIDGVHIPRRDSDR